MEVFEAIRTTRAMRRLDPAREVSEADLSTIVEAATKAANGGYPLGRWGEAPRLAAAEVTLWDRWGKTSADGSNDHVELTRTGSGHA